MGFAAVMLLVMLLSPEGQPYWVKTWEGAEVVHRKMVDYPNKPGVRAWTMCNQHEKVCTIYIVKGIPSLECYEQHELKHAKGWDHPNHEYANECEG